MYLNRTACVTSLLDQPVPFSHLFQTSCFPNVSRSCPLTPLWTIRQGPQRITAYVPIKRKQYSLISRRFLGSTKDSWKRMEQFLWRLFFILDFFCATKITTFIWRKRSTAPCFVSAYCSFVDFIRCILTSQEPVETVPLKCFSCHDSDCNIYQVTYDIHVLKKTAIACRVCWQSEGIAT